MNANEFEQACAALARDVADELARIAATPFYARIIDGDGAEYHDAQVCVDCAHVIANGTPTDDCAPDYAFPDDGLDWYSGDAERDAEFSWHACDCCGSPLGGARHHARWADPRAEEINAGLDVTVGAGPELDSFGWQSGDNSYSGAAYGYPYWGVATLTRGFDPIAVANEIIDQIAEAAYFDVVTEA